MNLANKITVFRLFLVPVFLLFYLTDFTPHNKIIALVIFLVASLSDKLDGYIARKKNLVTDFGKFLDPIADKVLVCSALICLTADGRIPALVTIIIISREFIVSAFRLVCAESGKTVAASVFGKIKTIFQMVMIIAFLINIPKLDILCSILMYLALIFTIISMIHYFVINRKILESATK